MIYAFGEYRLDTETFGLTRGGEPVHLDPQEFDVLLYLIEQRDRVVTRRELLDSLWSGRYVTDSALSSRLKAVRKAVGDSGAAQRVIQTVHGRGYRFVAPVASLAGPPAYTAPATTPPSGASATAAPVGHADPLLPGRERELAALAALFERAVAGASQIAFVSGEMGIGKTTLVEGFAATSAAAVGAVVLHGQCLSESAAAEPYLPLLDAIGRAARSSLGPTLADVLRRRAPTLLAHFPHVLPSAARLPDAGSPPIHERRLLLEISETLAELAAQGPLLLLLEDVQWADPSTLAWLDYVARRADPVPAMLVCTLRTGAGREAPVRLERELVVRGLALRVALEPLGEGAIHDCLAARLGREPDAATVAALRRYCSGQPLYMRLVVDGWLQATGAASPLESYLETIPSSLRELVDLGLSDLDEESIALFECAAVVGLEFSAPLVAAALEADEGHVEEKLVTLSRTIGHPLVAGEVDWPDGTLATRFRFGHHFYAQAIYDRQPVGVRRRRHRSIARRLAAAWADRVAAHGAELAHHFERGGEWSEAIHACRLGAHYAAERSAHREAADLLRRALRLVPQLADGADRDAIELELLVPLGAALLAAEGYAAPEAAAVYAQAREVGHRIGRGPHLLPVLYGSWNNALVAGRVAQAREIGVEFLELAEGGDEGALAVALRAVAWPDLLSGRFREADEGFARAIEQARELRPAQWLELYGEHPGVAAESASAWSAWFLGDTLRAQRAATAGVEHARALRHPFSLAYAYAAESVVLQMLGELDALEASTRQAIASATEYEIPLFGAWGRVSRGWLLARRGERAAGLELMQQGMDAYRRTGAGLFVSYFTGLLVDGLGRVGRTEEALDALAEGLALVEQTGERMLEAELQRCRGVLLLAKKERDADAAVRAFERAVAMATALGSPTLALRAALSWAGTEAQGRRAPGGLAALRRSVEAFAPDADFRDLDAARRLLAQASAPAGDRSGPTSRRRPT